MKLPLTVAAGALLALSAVAQAQAQSPTPAPNAAPSGTATGAPPRASTPALSRSGSIAAADRSFATKAASAGLAEVNDANIAQQKSNRRDIKDFAQRMVQDHTKANDQLKSIASGEGINLPTSESAADQKKTDALQKLSGARFDHSYITGQRTAHKQAVALFSKESKSGKDSQLKSFAGQTLPTLKDHLKMITGMPLTQKTSSAR